MARTKELSSTQSDPKTSFRLFKKAMKQRRGSVENVAETLMMALAASGESQENIAKVRQITIKGFRKGDKILTITQGRDTVVKIRPPIVYNIDCCGHCVLKLSFLAEFGGL